MTTEKMEQGSHSGTGFSAQPGDGGLTLFRLYVADDTVASTQAMSNLNAICMRHLDGAYEVELVDILNEPLRALSDGIIVTPTLVRVSPLPVRQIVGTLSDTDNVIQTLGLTESKNDGLG